MPSNGSSTAAHKIVFARSFLLYLYENGHISRDNGYTIKINKVHRIFYNKFCTEIKCRTSIAGIFFEVLRPKYLKKFNWNVWVFKDDVLEDIVLNQGEIKNATAELKNSRRRLLVDQPVAFRKPAKEDEPMYTSRWCKFCEVHFKSETEFNAHLHDEQHIFISDFHKAMRSPSKGNAMQKFEIQDIGNNKNVVVRPGQTTNITIVTKSIPQKKLYTINNIRWRKDVSEVTVDLPVFPIAVRDDPVGFPLSIRPKKSGIVYFPIIFDVLQGDRKETLPYELIFHVHSDDLDGLQPVESSGNNRYQKKATIEEFIGEIVPGERPPAQASTYTPKIKLPQYPFTSDMQRVLNNGLKDSKSYTDGQKRQLAIFNKALDVPDKSNPLNAANYTALLDVLLFIEEHQMKVDIRDYDKSDQELYKCDNPKLLRLKVAGLAERRPSLLKGDSVYIREAASSTTMYQGIVHTVEENAVLLGFNQKFLHSVFLPKKKFHVSFDYNRYTLKVEHLAVELTKKHQVSKCFFPKPIRETALPENALNSDIDWINKNIVSNPEQQQAVRAILAKTSKSAPYLIFGPPGTGKTMTMVEAIMQIYKRTPQQKMLVCAPSNDAANEVTKRLVKVIPSSDLLRYVALSYADHIPPDMRKYVNVSGREFYHPELNWMMKKRIVITTLAHASRLVTAGMEIDHFGYVFIDESGHATETETLIPIAGILSGGGSNSGKLNGQLVLAGDPEQLGPILHSKLALEYGFGISMLERLMKSCDTYKKDPTSKKYNPNVLTKLLKNYRSHPALIKVSNDLFYESEVVPAGDNMINVALNWEHLPNENFPMIFHSVQGIDQTEPNSPSFFNVQEIDVVMKYLGLLIGQRLSGMTIKEEHVAVISPYKKQVQKLNQACQKKGYNKQLSICSVEQIQGQERLIIIISTVRSRPQFLHFDHKFHLGFLKNSKRMNVAITRPKALLIVVGNPNVLQNDPNWKVLIEYCQKNHAIIGDKFQLNPDVDVEQLSEQLARLMEQGESSSEDKPNFARGNV